MVDTYVNKKCRVCGTTDELHTRSNKGIIVVEGICVSCFKAQRKKRYEKTKENFNRIRRERYMQNSAEIIEYNKKWREENKDDLLKKRRVHYTKNASEILKKQRERYATNESVRAKIKKRSRQWEQDHPDLVKKRSRTYYKKNRDKITKQRSRPERVTQRREYKKIKYKNNEQYKLRMDLSIAINKGLKRRGGSKDGYSCLGAIGYSIADLKTHLESLFEPWMNWNNHGVYNPKTWDDNDQSTWVWQIDHIISHAKFKYKTIKDDEFKRCWALSNLRPYSAKQNNIDRDR
jgi:hypothetical protein